MNVSEALRLSAEMETLRNYLYEYNTTNPGRIEDVGLAALILTKVYLSAEKWAQPILFFFYYINPVILTIGMFAYILKIITNGSEFQDYVRNSTIFMVFVCGCFIMNNFYSKKKDADELYDLVSDCPFVKPDDPALRGYHIFHNRLLFVALITTTTSCLFIFGITSILQYNNEDIESVLPLYYMVDLSKSFWRYFLEALEALQIIFIVVLITSLTSMFFCFLCYLEYHCGEIIKKLDVLKADFHFNIRRRNFIDVYNHHFFLLKYWTIIDCMFKYALLVYVMVGALVFGLIGIALIIEFQWFLFAVSVLCGTIFLVGGHAAWRLENKSIMVHEATFYAIPWDGDIAIAKSLQFMNLHTRRYFGIKLGNSTTFTYKTLIFVARIAYSVITFYRRTLQH